MCIRDRLSTKELKINFQSSLAANVLDSLTVTYSGAPSTTNNAFFNGTQGGTAVLSTLNEPYGAQDWFPTKPVSYTHLDVYKRQL